MTRAPGKAWNIYNFDGCRDDLFGGLEFLQVIEPGIGNIDNAYIGFVGSEGKTGGFNFGAGHTVEKSGFTHIGHPYNPAF
jgi:hypothetical protein